MKVLILGGGGREHALAHTFARFGHRVYCLPGNGGTSSLCEPLPEKWIKELPLNDARILTFAQEMQIDLTVVGPEDYLARGIVDRFNKAGKQIFGPTQEGAQLESSKAFAKAFMHNHDIPTASFILCKNSQEAKKAIASNEGLWKGFVVKPNGLTAGKGVVCCLTAEEAYTAVDMVMDQQVYGQAGQEIVLEELLEGREVSILAFCDGEHMLPLLSAQDHKRLLNGDQGPNTGGVGAYAPTPFVDREVETLIRDRVIRPTLHGLKREGICYKGILYFGLMLTDKGPQVLEYNCRFGDPETQALLPLLNEDLASLMQACCRGELTQKSIAWKKLFSCCVVVVSEGYPEKFSTGYPINLDSVPSNADNLILFHAGTKRLADGQIVTSGGRVLAVTGLGISTADAAASAYSAVEKINFTGASYRTDIGYQVLEQIGSEAS